MGNDPDCIECWAGSYSNTFGAQNCEMCPDGQTTYYSGATYCEDVHDDGSNEDDWSDLPCPEIFDCSFVFMMEEAQYQEFLGS